MINPSDEARAREVLASTRAKHAASALMYTGEDSIIAAMLAFAQPPSLNREEARNQYAHILACNGVHGGECYKLADKLLALNATTPPCSVDRDLVEATREARNTLHALRLGHRVDITATVERLDAALAPTPSLERNK